MLRHFLSLNVSHRQSAPIVNSIKHCAVTINSGWRTTVCHFGQGHNQAHSFSKRTDSKCVARTFDQAPLPVTRYYPVIHYRRLLVNADPIRNYATAVLTTRMWATRFARLPKRCKTFGAQFTTRHGIKRRVDGLVADTHQEFIRVHTWQYARDRLWREPLSEKLLNLSPQEIIRRQHRGFEPTRAGHASPLLSKDSVTTGQCRPAKPKSLCQRATPLITTQLSTHQARASGQARWNGPYGAFFLKAKLN